MRVGNTIREANAVGILSRRSFSTVALAAMLPPASRAAAPGDEARRAWDFEFTSIDDGRLPLSAYRGRVLLVVNTASFCGFTPQYRGLEAMYRELEPRGLTVVGVPSQDFGQESGSNAKVKAFCDLTYSVQFPMAGLSHVHGSGAVPFYQWVRAVHDGWEPRWNFYKVLIGRDGRVRDVFSSDAEPSSKVLTEAVNAALAMPEA